MLFPDIIRAALKPEPLLARGVLLDWDGTLLNSFHADQRAYAQMFRHLDLAFDPRALAKHYSPDWYRVYRALGVPRKQWNQADRLWRIAYGKEEPALMPGAREVLRKLKGEFILGMVTSGDRRRVRKQLKSLRLSSFFSVCVCAEDAPRRKPDPSPLLEAIGRLELKAAECVYVGDSAEDVEMAHRAGVRVIGVRGPFPTEHRVRAARPDRMLDSIRDLTKHLRALRK